MENQQYPNGEIERRLIKYIANFIIIALAAYCLPDECIEMRCVFLIALISSSTFALLDIAFPAIIYSSVCLS